MLDEINTLTKSERNGARYSKFEMRDGYLYSQMKEGEVFDEESGDDMERDGRDRGTFNGDLRVRFSVVYCGPTSVMAQQIQKDGAFTFRQWNPKNIDCPVG
jgi:hypothetical protein